MSHYRHIFVDTLIVLGTVLAVLFVYTIRGIILTLVVAIIFAAAVRPLVLRLQRRLIPQSLAILIVYAAILFMLFVLFLIVVPPLVIEAGQLVELAPGYLADLQVLLGQVSAIVTTPLEIDLTAAFDRLLQQLPTVAAGALQLTVGLVGAVFGLVLVFVAAFYWLVERNAILRTWLRLLPVENRQQAYDLWEEIESKLGAYVRGEMILVSIIGLLSYVGLTLLGVKYALVLALIAAVTEVIPMVGPFLGAVPAVIIAFIQSPLLGLAVAGLYLGIQELEGNVLAPKIMASAVGMSALSVLLALLIGGSLLGIVGAVVAVPVAAALNVVVQRTVLDPVAAHHEEQ